MRFSATILLFLASSGLLEARATRTTHVHRGGLQARQNKGNNNNANNGGSATCLAANALQTASEKTGQEAGTTGIAAGQAPSNTDAANFINFCEGQTLTNGQQNTAGSCNGIPMGKIPAKTNMITAIITFPQPGDTVTENTTFNVSVQTDKLNAGTFTNPQTTYYNAPQNLDNQGRIIGHCHVTVQNLGNSLRVTTPPDPTTFAFFKGIDDDGNGQGLLSAVVTGGLPAGFYRVCTMIAAANHQPVTMPVAQRGAQDDCTKFEVVASGANTGGNNNSNANANANAGNANTGTASASASTASTASANTGKTNTGKTSGNKGGKKAGNNANAGNGAAATSSAAAAAGNKAGTTTVSSAAAAATTAAAAAANNAGANSNVAIPTIKSGSLGGAAPAVTFSGNNDRPFEVNGNTFVNSAAAVQRSCDIQFNACANLANSGQLQGKSVSDCATQKSSCGAA